MLRFAALLPAFALLLAACGGGGDDASANTGGAGNHAGSSNATGGGARAMAAAIEGELGKLKDCYQGEKDGKGECPTDLLTNRVTSLCSDVRTNRPNDFEVKDYAVFSSFCTTWGTVLTAPRGDRPQLLGELIDKAKAIN